MKRILILTAFLIFACSSDDSSDSDLMEDTFLERFDSVVWLMDEYPEYDAHLYAFYNSPKSVKIFHTVFSSQTQDCSEQLLIQDQNEFGVFYNITENLGQRLVLISGRYENGQLISELTTNVTVYENGNKMRFEYEYYEDYNYTGNEEQVYINKTFTRVPELNDPCDY